MVEVVVIEGLGTVGPAVWRGGRRGRGRHAGEDQMRAGGAMPHRMQGEDHRHGRSRVHDRPDELIMAQHPALVSNELRNRKNKNSLPERARGGRRRRSGQHAEAREADQQDGELPEPGGGEVRDRLLEAVVRAAEERAEAQGQAGGAPERARALVLALHVEARARPEAYRREGVVGGEGDGLGDHRCTRYTSSPLARGGCFLSESFYCFFSCSWSATVSS